MKNLGKSLLGLALCAAMTFPAAVSCEQYGYYEYDDTEIRDQIDGIINKLYELEQKMNDEIGALKDLLAGKLLITDVGTNTETGVTTVELSNGTKLQLLPEKDLKSFVTYITSAGVDYWAYITEDGTKEYFKDENGEAIPVIADTPEVIVKDGETFIVIGGKEYPLSGNSVFSDYELITDEYTGEVYAVTFTFGEDMSFTVTVDGAAGFMFVKNDMIWGPTPVSEQYIPNGMTAQVQYQSYGVVDFVAVAPDGWRVKAYEDAYLGNGFEITAPSAELVESGIAAGEGELKVMAVLQGGKATVAKIDLTTVAFKEFGVSFGKASIKMNNGLYKYVYGVCEAGSFDEASIYAKALEIMGLYEYPAGYGVEFFDIVDMPVAEIMGADPVPGNSYTLWALPAFYDDAKEEYFLKEGTFVTSTFNYSTVKMEIVNQSSRDAKIDLEVRGAESYYFGLVKKEDYFAEDIVRLLNIPDYYTPKTEMIYSGSAFELAGTASESSTEYVVWLAVAGEGKVYDATDLVTCEFSTEDLQPGSPVKVTAEVAATALDVTASVSAEGCEMIYYTFLTAKNASNYADDASRAAYLFEKGLYVSASEVEVKASEFMKIKPETALVLMALATDSDGKYSEVLYKECATTALQYNEMKVEVNLALNSPEEVRLNVSVTGGEAVEYLYWIGKTSDNTWKSTNYLGGNAETAQQYMYLNSTASRFTSIADKYPITDGVITIDDHTPGIEYVIVIMAKGADGLYSKASVFKFIPYSVNIGTVVLKDDAKYEAARPEITWNPEEFIAGNGLMYGVYSYNVTVPEGFTAYILSGTDNFFYDIDPSTGEVIPRDIPVDEKIITVMDLADKRRDSDYYDEDGNPTYYSFQHGDPNQGNVVLWASQEFHDSRCGCGAPYDREGTFMGNAGTIHHALHFNNGTPFKVRMPYGFGDKTKVVDKVFIVCQDIDGNCYETFEWDVPVELFANSKNEW